MKKMRRIVVAVAFALLACALTACGFLERSGGDDEKPIAKVALTEDMVNVYGTYLYTGEPVTVDEDHFSCTANGRNVVMSSFLIEYENNVEVGEATMIITAKSDNQYVKGTVRVHFTIQEDYQRRIVSTKAELMEELAAKRYSDLQPDFDLTIEEGETLTVDHGKGFHGLERAEKAGEGEMTYTCGITVVNNGTIVIGEEGRFSLGGSNDYHVTLINNGTLTVNGKLYLNHNAYLYNAGTVTTATDTSVENYGAVYTNSAFDTYDKGYGSSTLRQEINAQSVSLVNPENGIALTEEGGAMRFQSETSRNKARVLINDNTFYGATYEGNEHAGTVNVTITAEATDRMFYGSYRTSYELHKGETRIEDFSTFADVQASGDFDTYRVTHYGGFTIEDVTIRAEETLILTETATLTSLTNYGTVSVEPRSYASLSIGGTLTNYGAFRFAEATVDGPGTLVNGSPEAPAATAIGKYLHVASVLSYGTIETESVSANTQITNYGSINTPVLYCNGALRNAGEIESGSFTIGSFTEGEDSSYVDEAGATLVVTGEGKVRGGTFTVNGSVTIRDKMAFASVTGITVAGRIDSEGTIYAFEEVPHTGGAFVLRKNVTDEDVAVELEYYSVPYDGTTKKPALTVDGNSVETTYGRRISYLYYVKNPETGEDDLTGVKQDDTYTKVGSIFVTLNITDEYYPYFGSTRLYYRIEYATALVETDYTFSTYVGNANYNVIRLGCDVELRAATTISAGRTLDTNGYTLTVDGSYSLTINGTLYVRPVEDKVGMESVGLFVGRTLPKYSPLLTVNGTVENTGVVYLDPYARFSGGNARTFVNDGTIYTHADAAIGATGEGVEYVRRPFTTGGAYTVEIEYEETVYDDTDKEPAVTVTKYGEAMDTSVWTITYENNHNAGDASVSIETEDLFDRDFYGKRTYPFVIKRATKELTSGGFFYSADIADAANYDRYVQKSNLKVGEVSFTTIPAGVTLVLDLANYTLDRGSRKFKVSEGAGLEVIVDSVSEFDEYKYGATKIVFGADFGETSDALTLLYSKNQTLSDAIYYGKAYELTVDFNGHAFGGTMSVQNNDDNSLNTNKDNNPSVTILSTGEKGTLGYGGQYAFRQIGKKYNTPNSTLTITLDNLKIYGADFGGGGNGYVVVTATNCDFEQIQAATNKDTKCHALLWISKEEEVTGRASAAFTNCTFKAFYATVQIYGGDITFTDCAFTSTATDYVEPQAHSGDCIVVCQAHNSSMRTTTVTLVGGTLYGAANAFCIEYSIKNNATSYTTIRSTATVLQGRPKYGW